MDLDVVFFREALIHTALESSNYKNDEVEKGLNFLANLCDRYMSC